MTGRWNTKLALAATGQGHGMTKKARRWILHPIQVFSLIPLAISLTALAGHIAGHSGLIHTGAMSVNDPGMAINTSVCIIILSLLTFGLAVESDKDEAGTQ